MISASKTVDLGLNQAVSVDELYQSSLGGDLVRSGRSGVPALEAAFYRV
jgi:hypothetical protein